MKKKQLIGILLLTLLPTISTIAQCAMCRATVESTTSDGRNDVGNGLNFGILYMLLFGLGTVPLMSAVVYLNLFLTNPIRNQIQKMIPYFAVVIGILFILRGLGIGIPYVSPANMSLFVQENPNCH